MIKYKRLKEIPIPKREKFKDKLPEITIPQKQYEAFMNEWFSAVKKDFEER